MTTDEAIESLDKVFADYNWFGIDHGWAVIKAELARVTAERDRLIEAWPDSSTRTVLVYEGDWYVGMQKHGNVYECGPFATRQAAVRAAAGLGTEGDK